MKQLPAAFDKMEMTPSERDADGNGGFARGIKIKDRCFHANGAAQSAFKSNFSKVLDERREFRGTGQGKPIHGLAIGASDGSKGAPFVDD